MLAALCTNRILVVRARKYTKTRDMLYREFERARKREHVCQRWTATEKLNEKEGGKEPCTETYTEHSTAPHSFDCECECVWMMQKRRVFVLHAMNICNWAQISWNSGWQHFLSQKHEQICPNFLSSHQTAMKLFNLFQCRLRSFESIDKVKGFMTRFNIENEYFISWKSKNEVQLKPWQNIFRYRGIDGQTTWSVAELIRSNSDQIESFPSHFYFHIHSSNLLD